MFLGRLFVSAVLRILSGGAFVIMAAIAASPKADAAASICKGADHARCAVTPGCRWIKGIVMKNGKPRRAHCRKGSVAKPAKAAS